MSSTVTTTTVSTMTSAITLEGLMATFTLICVLLLAGMVFSKEISSVGQGVQVRRFARGLDIAMWPLLMAFATVLVLRSLDFFSGF